MKSIEPLAIVWGPSQVTQVAPSLCPLKVCSDSSTGSGESTPFPFSLRNRLLCDPFSACVPWDARSIASEPAQCCFFLWSASLTRASPDKINIADLTQNYLAHIMVTYVGNDCSHRKLLRWWTTCSLVWGVIWLECKLVGVISPFYMDDNSQNWGVPGSYKEYQRRSRGFSKEIGTDIILKETQEPLLVSLHFQVSSLLNLKLVFDMKQFCLYMSKVGALWWQHTSGP